MMNRLLALQEYGTALCSRPLGVANIVALNDLRREREVLTAISVACAAVVSLLLVILLTAVLCLGRGQDPATDLGLAGIDQTVTG